MGSKPEGASTRQKLECEHCKEAETAFAEKVIKKYKIEKYLFTSHLNVQDIKGKLTEKEVKRRALKVIEKKVSALRNTTGGYILIHLDGQEPSDRYLGHLEDFIDGSLKKLIPDGKLFTDVYNRKWLCEDPSFIDLDNIVLLEVEKSEHLATVDFNTKLSSDFMIENPSTLNVLSLLRKGNPSKIGTPCIRGIEDHGVKLHENRYIQLKYFPKDKTEKLDVHMLVNYIWNELRFKENLSSLSKLQEGGSYFIGICENTRKKHYESKEIDLVGFEFKWDQKEFTHLLIDKLKSAASLQTPEGKLVAVPEGLVQIKFHNHPKKRNFYILEIAVGFANGVVFYKEKGPETYTVKNGMVHRMEHSEWLKRIKCFPCLE